MHRHVHCWWVTILAIEAVRQLGKYFVDRGPHGFQQMVLTDPFDSMYSSAALAQAHILPPWPHGFQQAMQHCSHGFQQKMLACGSMSCLCWMNYSHCEENT